MSGSHSRADGAATGANQRFVWLSCLRAFGVILVLVYHFFPAILPGGFIGVDVFFVFSGYLITSLLIKEFMAEGHVGLAAFYIRRLRRLAPAVVAMILLTLPFALLISPDYRVQIAQQTAAALSWTTNFYEIAAGSSYADVLLPHLFVHTWTLAIEMQYYIVWGAVLFFALPALLQHLHNGRLSLGRARKVLIIVAAAAALASFAAMQILLLAGAQDAAAGVFADPSPAYFNTISHIYPLMIGSLVGVTAGYPRTTAVRAFERLNPKLALAVVVVSLAIIAVLARVLSFEAPAAFNYGILATSLLCGLVLLVGRGMQGRLAHVPEPRVLTYLAETSYSLYLFHWPAMLIVGAFGQQLAAVAGNAVGAVIIFIANIIALVLTFILGHLSYHLIEKPFSVGGKGPEPLRSLMGTARIRIAAAVVSVLLVVFCVFSVASAPILNSMDIDLRRGALALEATRLEATHTALAPLGEYHDGGGAIYIGLGMADKVKQGSATLIGDSVAVYPSSAIADASGADVDAEVGRSMESGVPLILTMQANGTLGEDVIVALATNTHAGSLDAAVELCEQIAPGHRLIFVTAHGVGHGEMSELSAELRKLPERYPYVYIADWDAAIAPHEEWLAADGYHCAAQESIDLYAQTVLDALEAARKGPKR